MNRNMAGRIMRETRRWEHGRDCTESHNIEFELNLKRIGLNEIVMKIIHNRINIDLNLNSIEINRNVIKMNEKKEFEVEVKVEECKLKKKTKQNN